jgi:hypothetical protein
MSPLTDTSPEAERVLADVCRRMSPGDKWLQLGSMYHVARTLHAAGVLFRNPGATRRDIHEAWMTNNLNFTRKDLIREPRMDPPISSLRELRSFLAVIDRLGLTYALGGLMASSIYGIGRYTQDADVTLEPFAGREAEFAKSFGPDYYVSLPAIEEAVRSRCSFNVIDTSAGFKIDVFVRKDDEFEQSAMQRRIAVTLPDLPDKPIVLHSAEDVILFKLHWYRLGNETSEQQLKDVRGVFTVQGDRLGQQYLDHWALKLGVGDLLERVRRESAV